MRSPRTMISARLFEISLATRAWKSICQRQLANLPGIILPLLSLSLPLETRNAGYSKHRHRALWDSPACLRPGNIRKSSRRNTTSLLLRALSGTSSIQNHLCNLFFHFHGGFHIPRTHGRLYDKWILPDWVDVPVERHRELGIILTRLKAALDKRALRSKKRYLHPNESVLLPLAHWPSSSALSGNRLSTGEASTSTIQPRSPLIQEGKPHSRLSVKADTPLTPPGTPLEPAHDTQVSFSCGEDVHVLDAVSLVSVRNDELPYYQAITATTPSLYVQLDGLSLTLEFIQVFSGQLWIAQAEDAAWSKKYQLIDVRDIPTTTQLQLSCSDNSNELTIQLQHGQKGIVCFTFAWFQRKGGSDEVKDCKEEKIEDDRATSSSRITWMRQSSTK